MTDVCCFERFNTEHPTEVNCDASANCLGVIQRIQDNDPVLIEYSSRVLNDYEGRYTNTERKLLVVEGVVNEKFRHCTKDIYGS